MRQQISLLTLLCYSLTIILLITLSHPKLIYLSQIYRHGARYPLHDYYDYNQTKQFRGLLTSIGLRQHFLLGSYIQNQYIIKEKFINQTLNYRETEFFTMITDTERCEQSAYANKLGLFGFNKGAKIPSGIDTKLLDPPFQSILSENLRTSQPQYSQNYALFNGFQPTPIRYGMQYFPDCKNLNILLSRRSQLISKQLAQFQTQQAAFTDKMRLVFNMSLSQSNLKGLQDLADTLISDKFLGREMPEKFTDDDYKQIYFIRGYLLSELYAGEVSEVINSPYLHVLISNMEHKISNPHTYTKKLSTYSVHDLNIIPILTYFNLTSGDCLKYSKTKLLPFNVLNLFLLHQI